MDAAQTVLRGEANGMFVIFEREVSGPIIDRPVSVAFAARSPVISSGGFDENGRLCANRQLVEILFADRPNRKQSRGNPVDTTGRILCRRRTAPGGGKEVPLTTPLSTRPVEAPYLVQADRAATLSALKDHHELAKRLMAVADKAQVEEAARVLAVHVGYYQRRYGKAPMEETLAALHADTPTDTKLADTAEGLRCLIAVLMLATEVADESGGTA